MIGLSLSLSALTHSNIELILPCCEPRVKHPRIPWFALPNWGLPQWLNSNRFHMLIANQLLSMFV